MWTPATRGRMAEIEKKTRRYPTDLTDEEWARICPFLPVGSKNGRHVETDLGEVLNAIRYLARSGGGWRMLPKDFPPWQTVYWWFRRFVRRFSVPDDPRCGAEAGPRAGRTRGEPDRRCYRQPVAQGSRSENKRLRCGQEGCRTQAAHCGRHRWPPLDVQPHRRRHLRQYRRADDPRHRAQALAVAQAPLRRRRL